MAYYGSKVDVCSYKPSLLSGVRIEGPLVSISFLNGSAGSGGQNRIFYSVSNAIVESGSCSQTPVNYKF